MVDHLSRWPITKAIPDKEATTVANAILRNLYLNMVHLKFFSPTKVRSLSMILWPMCVRSSILNNILQALTQPGQMERQNFNKFLKASISKLCQKDIAAWDQVLDQILFAYRCCLHTSKGEAPYTLLCDKDPPLLVQKVTKCMEPYKGKNMLGKRIEQSRITLSMAAKMLERMRAKQKRHYQHWRATHKLQVCDLVLLKKHNADNMDLRWESNYRVVRLMSPWSAVVENQMSVKTKRCNVGDLKLKPPSKHWELKPSLISRGARFINHPVNLPDIDTWLWPATDSAPWSKGWCGHQVLVRRSIKVPTKLDL